MSNGDDPRVPIGPVPIGRPPRIDREPPRIGVRRFIDERRGGFPQPAPPIFPLPTPPPRQPTAPVRFPTGPAANDPVFSRAGQLLRTGNVIVGVAIILDALIRKVQDLDIEEEFREREAVFELETRRRALERTPIEIEFPAPRPEPEPFDPADIPSVPDLPSQIPGATPIEIPGVQVPPAEQPRPGQPTPGPVVAPTTPTAPRPATVPAPAPATIPGIGTSPGVFTPTPSPTTLPIGVPSPVPGLFPLPTPIGRPNPLRVGDPLTPIGATPVPSGPTAFVDPIQFPQPVPQPETARRCEPCPQEEPPSLRDACFKGLYREGPFTDDVDFVEWAEIDCFTGVEI